MKAGSRLQVKIEKLAIGGAGIARHDGLVIFVALAAPGDELFIEITKSKKNFAEGRILQILKAGPGRRETPCPVASLCGGCNWQHLTQEVQLTQKEMLVRETLQKFLPDQNFSYLPIQASPRDFRYRNRIQPKLVRGHFGFFARESHRLVEIDDCLITEESLAAQIPAARDWALGQGTEGRLEMRLDENAEVHFSFTDEDDGGIGFSQVNRFQNEDLIQTVLAWSKGRNYRRIYDLYSGSGNFSFPLAELHHRPVTAVELSRRLVEKGREVHAAAQVRFIESDVTSYMETAAIDPEDLVVLDPPRAGCSELVMRRLARLRPQKIIYISCHPVSLARDLKWFFDESRKLSAAGPRLLRVQAFEMFPQTDHVETIAELGVDSEVGSDTF